MENYKWVDGQPLKEKNLKWLQNDYVKFIRWGQWTIAKTGHGILAMITQNSYHDGKTHPGMRRQLLNNFNEIYILDLHGDKGMKEKGDKNLKDDNVLDKTSRGVAISILIKRQNGPTPARLFYSDKWGLRKDKDNYLAEMEIITTPWIELQPHSPSYLFVPQETDLRAEYDRGWPVNKIFPINSERDRRCRPRARKNCFLPALPPVQ